MCAFFTLLIVGAPGKSSILRLFTPIVHGTDAQGIFSIAFRYSTAPSPGDYECPEEDGPNLAFTDDGQSLDALEDFPAVLLLRCGF